MYALLETTKESLIKKYTRVFFVVAIYWIISILTVFVNKALFSSIQLDATLFITWVQCICSTVICFSMSLLGKSFPRYFSFPEGNPFQIETFKRVIPLSFLFTLMIGTNNLCLKHVSVAFYYVGRSLTTVFNVILTYFLLGEKQSYKSILCCAVIVAGFLLGVDQESLTSSFSVIGTVFGVLGSLFLTLFSIFTKKTLPHVNQEIWLLSYYNNLYSCFLFVPLIVFSGEFSNVYNYVNIREVWFWGAMVIGGLCGFCIGYVTSLQIQVTSPLTHNISGTAKACAQTVLATTWYSDAKSLLWWTSNMIVLFGSFLYARVKQLEMAIKWRQTQTTQKL